MNRLTSLSTLLGLCGLALAMMVALIGGQPSLIALGLGMMALGFAGAVVGAAIALGRAWETAR